jgi:hypothetical protein
MKTKTLKEIAIQKNKKLFIESYSVVIPTSNIKLLEDVSQNGSIHLIESREGEKYKCLAIVKSVPVSKFTENLNNRVYSKKLWEKVQKNKVAEGTLCLADHPSDDTDGSVKDIVGVWRNFKVNEDHCNADLYLIGKHGKQFLEVLQAGGRCGLSSVGFGELLEDEKTVNPDTYELVRVSDWVLTPSQGVYAETSHIDSDTISINENVKQKNKNNTNLIERNYNKMENSVQALTIRNNVKFALKESEKAIQSKGSSLVESKKDLQELLSYIPESYTQDRSTIEKQISLIENTIKQTIKDKTIKLKENEKTTLSLNEKYNTANVVIQKLKERHDKANKVIKLLSQNESLMKKDINSFMGERVGMTKDLKALKEDRSKMIYDIKKLIQERGNILSDMRQSMKDKITMSEDIENLIQDRKTLMSDLRTTLEDTKVMKKDIQKLVKENSILKKKVRRYSEEGYEDIEPAEVPEMDDVQDAEYSDENYDLAIDPSMAYASDDEDFGGIPFTNYNDESGFLENKSRKTNKKSKMKEFVIRKKPSLNRQNRDVVEYFENKVKEKPILRKIREQIVSQPSLVKAVNMIERYLRNDEEKPYRIMESVKSRHYDWVGNRDI